jgi:hypothetical protein
MKVKSNVRAGLAATLTTTVAGRCGGVSGPIRLPGGRCSGIVAVA